MVDESSLETFKTERKKAVTLFEDLSPIFVALGDKVRQKIIVDIACGADVGVNVTYLTRKARLSRPAVSYHIKILRECGLIKPVKYGTQIFYKLNFTESVNSIDDLISSVKSLIVLKKQVDKELEERENSEEFSED